MPSFFLALLACFVASAGARDQRLVAALSARLGAGNALLAASWMASAITACIAAVAGAAVGSLLPPAGKAMFVAFALLAAAVELALPIRQRDLDEPTRSVFAVVLVLIARQIGDGARFLIAAIAAATGVPVLAALGGAIGAGAALTLGWGLGGALTARLPLRPIRSGIAGILLFAALWTGLSARGII